MTTDRGLGAVRYTALCAKGRNLQTEIYGHLGRRRRVAALLMNAEEDHPLEIPHYRDELASLKATIADVRGTLMQHAAHCSDGCVRDTSGGPSNSMYTNAGAPAHNKPALPPMADIAARLRNGEALEAIALQYERHPATIAQKLGAAGFSSRDGRNLATPRTEKKAPAKPRISLIADEPWRDEALCTQTDPESFFPEKGGSTREAKSVCAKCTVAAECLDYALEHEERFGIWGGLSERERRKLKRAIDQESA